MLRPKYSKIKSFLTKNWSILPFFIYLVLNIILQHEYPGIAITMTYYILGILIFYFYFIKEKYISKESVLIFQWGMIITGLIQFGLYKTTGYQLSFIDAEHYELGGSFAKRLRGFFVEPNWYGIVFAYNSLLMIMLYHKKIFEYKFLLFFTMLCIMFNASYTFLGVVVLGILIRFFIDFPKVSKSRMKIIFLGIFFVGALLSIRSYTKVETNKSSSDSATVINYGSRLFPVINTVLYMSKQSTSEQLLGIGIGSWPYVGLEQNKLGYIGMGGEYTIKPAQRDSAEVQVFILELGYLGLFLFIFDYIYNYWKYRRLNLIYSLATAFMLASFFIYPVFKFAMYLVPFYIIRAKALKRR